MVGSQAKGVEVGMSETSGWSRQQRQSEPGPPRLATWELPSVLKPWPQFCQL